MSLYNNFNEENKADVLWEKIYIMLENKNAVNRVLVLRKIVRLRYQDDYNMAEHLKPSRTNQPDHLARSTP